MALFTQRNFFPLFITQALGVFNDNLFKSALTMLVTYKLAQGTNIPAAALVTLGGGIFMVPYVLFSGFAGQLADKYEKTNLTQWIKLSEVLIMLAGLMVVLAENMVGMFFLLFLMGTHSTFFGPIKYGILPQALPKSQLVAANGLFEGSTFLAILAGTMFGSYFALQPSGEYLVGITGTLVALIGLVGSYFIPLAPGVDPKLKLDKNIIWQSLRIVAYAKKSPDIYRALLTISWFWALGAIILSIIPVYSAQILHGNEGTTTFLLSLFSIGIAIGSILCQKILGTSVNLRYVPLSAVLLSVFGFGLVIFSLLLPAFDTTQPFNTLSQLLSLPVFWPLTLCFIGLAMMGGIFTVPLYAFIQATGETSTKSRLIAANNVLNAVAMVAAAAISSAMFAFGTTLLQMLTIIMSLNLLAALYAYPLMPHTSKQRALQAMARLFWGVKIINPEYLHNLPRRTLVVSNHVSFLDAFLIAIFVPIRLTFAIDVGIAKKWWVKPCLNFVNAFPLDTANPYAIRNLINLAKTDEPIMIFPEGRLTKTGTLMKVYDGTAMVAVNADCTILPLHLEGLQFSKVSRLKGVLPRLRWFPRVTITVSKPVELDLPETLRGRQRRIAAGQKLQNLMAETMFAATPLHHTLFTSLLKVRHNYGPKWPVLMDIENNISYNRPFTYADIAARSILMAGLLKREGLLPAPYTKGQNIQALGILLPNAAATAITFFALQAAHAIPAMLNFSAGPDAVISACNVAGIQHVLTSKRFIEKGKLETLVTALEKAGIKLVYLEDVRAKLKLSDKLKLLIAVRKPEWFYAEAQGEPNHPAAILFTSGSEGKPKGVVLSHVNFNANTAQAHTVVDFTPQDVLLNALPMFHSFGLTGGTLLPLMYGVPVFLYPSPLHYRLVPEMAYQFNTTIMFGTDTFLNGYARYANGYDFYRMRYVFAGAEKVKPETRKTWMEKFGIRILEGYGATETTPVLALNTPLAYKAGSVGKLVPGMEYKLEHVEGIEHEGHPCGNLFVKGPNVMLGYLKSDAPGKLQPPKDGWHELGDIVTVDDGGYITIEGRLKRFAKIGGEMISLTAVEALATACWPDSLNAVVALPDDRKGEQLILFTTQPKATREQLRKHSREHGGTDLALPRTLELLDKIPTLATGKTDYVSLTEVAKKLV